jgi:plasmid stabilization system protein ParE
MAQPVFASSRARLQIAAIVDYLNEYSPSTGRRFLDRLGTAYQQLADFPLSGPRGPVPGTRRLVVTPYILTYRITRAGIEILDIRHGRQRTPPAPAPDDAV